MGMKSVYHSVTNCDPTKMQNSYKVFIINVAP
jgi:hypothetical protein